MGRQSSSPESGPHALLAAAENVTGLVLDDDPQFIKEESSSPGPDGDHDTPFRRQPFKFKSVGPPQKLPGTPAGKASAAHHQERIRRHGGKAASRANHPKGPPVAGQPIVPRKTEDWDPWKGVLHELYITQNRILRDIIGIMETKHNLRAT